MFCEKCKVEFNGNSCPQCGSKVENRLFDGLKKFMYDDNETIVSVLGNNVAQTFLSTGVLGKGFAILSDKRVYFKGTCLIRKGKGFYSKIEEKSVDIRDVTGTGFVHNKATWANVLKIISLVLAIHASVLMPLLLITGVELIANLPSIVFAVGFYWGIYFLFKFLYARYNYSAFEISYAGGGIAFDLHWINEVESRAFQKELNMLKDRIRAASSDASSKGNDYVKLKTDSIPEQLKQYKDLLDRGIITAEEFEAKKKQLLGL